MSSAELDISHLTQKELSPKDKKILVGLQDWLSTAVFDPKNNICADKSLGDKWALLSEMDLIKKFTRPVYQIRRVPALGPPKPFDPKGPPNAKAPHSMTPMRVIEGNPTVSGQDIEQRKRDIEQGKNNTKQWKKVLPLVIGWTTYITEEVEVEPAVDILFITSRPFGDGQ